MMHRWASMATGATPAMSVMWACVVVFGHLSDAQTVVARGGSTYTVRSYSIELRHELTPASPAAAVAAELSPAARCRAGLAQAHLEMAVVAN